MAEKYITDILREDNTNVDAWLALGNISVARYKFSEAAKYYQKAYRLDPSIINRLPTFSKLKKYLFKYHLLMPLGKVTDVIVWLARRRTGI